MKKEHSIANLRYRTVFEFVSTYQTSLRETATEWPIVQTFSEHVKDTARNQTRQFYLAPTPVILR